MPNITAERRDEMSPVWDMSQERAFLENLHGQRFNFFLIFFGFVLNGAMNSRNQAYLLSVLATGTVVCWLLALTLRRSQQKLDIILEEIFKDDTHPATIANARSSTAVRGGKLRRFVASRVSGSKRRLIGYHIPTLCCLLLTVGLILAATGVLAPQAK